MPISQKTVIEELERRIEAGGWNRVSAEDAIREDLSGMRLFDEPIFGFGDADDPVFETWKRPEVIHPEVMLPKDWLPGAKTVISYFFPFTEQVRHANAEDMKSTSDEWLHGRIEGQEMIAAAGRELCSILKEAGYEAVCPSLDPRFRILARFASNWSERHAAYICGLGTFGLSKGLITEKGVAGRFGSVITSCAFPVTKRPYQGLTDYCIMCGKCQLNCPAHAIDKTKGCLEGKNHDLCSAYVNANARPPHGPHKKVRYGCGKCQVAVPCSAGIPGRAGRHQIQKIL